MWLLFTKYWSMAYILLWSWEYKHIYLESKDGCITEKKCKFLWHGILQRAPWLCEILITSFKEAFTLPLIKVGLGLTQHK